MTTGISGHCCVTMWSSTADCTPKLVESMMSGPKAFQRPADAFLGGDLFQVRADFAQSGFRGLRFGLLASSSSSFMDSISNHC